MFEMDVDIGSPGVDGERDRSISRTLGMLILHIVDEGEQPPMFPVDLRFAELEVVRPFDNRHVVSPGVVSEG